MDDLDVAKAAAAAGAQVVRRHFGTGVTATLKGNNDPVTEVDRESERVIVDLIRSHRPDDTIIGEEGTATAGGVRRWLIDPLDGTVNFVHSLPHIAVSIGLLDGNEPLAAVVVDPLRNEVFSSSAGNGADLDGRAITVSGAEDLKGTVVATGFAYDHDRYAADYTRPVTAVLERVNGVRRFGSAALDLAWVAAGRLDAYWEHGVAPWDIAAGILLVREAGGVATDAGGRPATPETSLIVTAGPGIHEVLRLLIEENLPERLRDNN